MGNMKFEEFPSLVNKKVAYYPDTGKLEAGNIDKKKYPDIVGKGNLFLDKTIEENCLDKKRVREVIDKCIKILKDKEEKCFNEVAKCGACQDLNERNKSDVCRYHNDLLFELRIKKECLYELKKELGI